MFRLSEKLKKLEDKLDRFLSAHKKELPKLCGVGVAVLYFYGMAIRSVSVALARVWDGSTESLVSLNPVLNLAAVFTPQGLMISLFVALMYCLFTKKGYQWLSGYKTVRDKERGIEILPEGTHGTSGWMDKKELPAVLAEGSIESLTVPLFGKLDSGSYVAMKDLPGMSKNIMVFGAPGTGKSRGFVMPFAMQAARRGESLILVDPKAEFYEMYSEFFRDNGYTVRAYNLLDLCASDGWNCVMDTASDINLVQRVAEIIIRNTSSESDRDDFWAKAEKNLLMALLHYVGTLTYPGTNRLLPIEERSLGTIYTILSTTSVQELDARFRALPSDHPALPPYGIFRQAHKQIWGNIVIGLGNRLNVFQNKLVDDITKHSEIDLTLPGKQKCAYFCIISDQDSSLEFLSSMFFSLLFDKLFDFARSQENRRLPVCVNVLMDEFCNIALLDSKKIFSVARSRNINIQAVAQSIAQLSDRYPKDEWQEITGDCDYQLFLGCNDTKTANYISEQCGEITVRVNNANVPMTPLFSPVLHTTRPYTHGKTSTGRPLMMPDEVRRLPRDKAILLVRGAKPLLLTKITPEEHPSFRHLRTCKAIDYIPLWRKNEEQREKAGAPVAQSQTEPPAYAMRFAAEPEDTLSEEYIPDEQDTEPEPHFDLSGGIDCRKLTEVSPKEI